MLRQCRVLCHLSLPALCVAGAVCAPAVLADAGGTDGLTISTAAIEGQNIDGVGAVTRIDAFAINDLGEWLVEADTDHADTDADSVLLRMDGLYLREGDPLAEPAGAALDAFDSIVININGDSFWNFFLDNLPIGEDSGLYFNDTLVIQESTISTAPEFSPNTPYIGFFETKWTDNNIALVMASVDDPNIPSSVDRGLVIIEFDPDSGDFTERVIAKERDMLPGQTEPVADFETDPENFAFSNAGSAMYIADLTGDTAFDSAIYLDDILLAQEGFASPIEGVDWASLSSARVDVNGSGDWAFRGRLDAADDDVIIRNGEVFIREGDSPPGFDGFSITSLGAGPVLLNNGGDVVWSAEWDDPDDDVNSGIFLNDEILVQEGVSSINGRIVDTLRDVRGSNSTGASGGWIIFEAVLTTGQEGAFVIEVPPSATPADLTGFEIVIGTLLEGDLAIIETSDAIIYWPQDNLFFDKPAVLAEIEACVKEL